MTVNGWMNVPHQYQGTNQINPNEEGFNGAAMAKDRLKEASNVDNQQKRVFHTKVEKLREFLSLEKEKCKVYGLNREELLEKVPIITLNF